MPGALIFGDKMRKPRGVSSSRRARCNSRRLASARETRIDGQRHDGVRPHRRIRPCALPLPLFADAVVRKLGFFAPEMRPERGARFLRRGFGGVGGQVVAEPAGHARERLAAAAPERLKLDWQPPPRD